jgi:hypothetical protein
MLTISSESNLLNEDICLFKWEKKEEICNWDLDDFIEKDENKIKSFDLT